MDAIRPHQRRHAPATLRNRDPILDVLKRILTPRATVLEIASGTGEHAIYFAANLPNVTWQPTDRDEAAIASIEAHRELSGLNNLRTPLFLDAAAQSWPTVRADAIVCINMIHIAPWEACLGLFAGAGRLLGVGAKLALYGPFSIGGRHISQSNQNFDHDLRARNPDWGVRDRDMVVAACGEQPGLVLSEQIAMPANNFILIFTKIADSDVRVAG